MGAGEFRCGVIEGFYGEPWSFEARAGYAAFLASGTMATAYFMAHAPSGFWPIMNHGELAVVYCFVFLYIASRGSGRLSLEGLLKKGRL